ncbi:hypothetical protein [Exiguobacterium sp. s193]|uniref:hypothetical protein n=1 Tax=Exiguobacterium sp. s193 TaxID=2751207 RepID=UPI001BE876C2|nr:hypothetical protein [Exiguobacterium sp. s193]
MTLFYIFLAAVICYALLLLFKQQASLKDRVNVLEREKRETEEILLRFMEQVNGLTGGEEHLTGGEEQKTVEQSASASADESYEMIVPPDTTELPHFGEPEVNLDDQPALTDVKDQLATGADIDQLARSLNRGTGEVALIAKLSQKTKVARR